MKSQKWNPDRILEISGSYWQTCVLHAGVKLDVFTTLGDRQLSGKDLVQELNGDRRGVTMLLNALAAMKLLIKKGDQYSNTSVAKSFLSRNSTEYIGHIIIHHHHLMDSWAQLDDSVRTGRPVRKRTSQNNEEWRESFLMGMFNLAMSLAPRLVKKIDLSHRHRLLDLGAGPGTYAIHFCLENPGLKATVYDLPTTRPFALKTIESFGLTDRIDFVEGNYVEGSIEGSYDVVWLSHILHAEGPEDCRRIIGKAVSAMEPGGMIIVHDFILDDTMDGPLFPALFSLNMLLGTENGQSYSEEHIRDMLAGAGIKEIQRISMETSNDSGIITGIV